MSPSRPYAAQNRQTWNERSDWYQAQHGPQLNAMPLAWGVWAIPDSEIGALGDVDGKIVLELGCGGGQWSRFLADAGARPVALDLSERQLSAARKLMRTPYPLVQADGEDLPFTDSAFDVVLSDHGAMSWADPYRTVPEAARVLRPGGRLAFNATTPWLYLGQPTNDDAPQSPTLNADYFSLHRVDEGNGSATFGLTYGAWIRLFRRCGLDVEDLIELRPPEGATTTYDSYVTYGWARRWPAEQIWVTARR
jgi:SAM-dependent methyltransferase